MRKRVLIIWTLLLLIGICLPLFPARAVSAYEQLILDRFTSSIVGYWPLTETGGTTINEVAHGYNGTYSGVTLNQIDGPGAAFGRAGLWDGVNDYGDVFSSGLASAFNKATGSLAIWIKVHDSGVWTDGTTRWVFLVSQSLNNIVRAARTTSNNVMRFRWLANGLGPDKDTSLSSTDWIHLLWTWNEATDSGTIYVNGSSIGTWTNTSTWSAAIINAVIGAANNTGSSSWYGYLQHALILNREATSDDAIFLANTNPITPTLTPTITPTGTNTPTPRPPQLIATLQNGNQWELDYTITAGQIGQFVPILLFIGLFIFIMILKLVKR